ncbi:MAG TPA: squalene--hopene cyclase [Acidimicrobiales bacterium]|nr:squalene--hopene cyclase [Acidimicrobiales bacterium]
MSDLNQRESTETPPEEELLTPPTPPRDVRETLRRAVDQLISLQDPNGWWKGELETNVSIDAEDLLLREFLGVRTEAQTVATARWIRSRQREDGTWANYHGGPADLSTTIEAYVALRLAGDSPEDDHLCRAADFIRTSGGIENSRVFTRIWLALFGLWPWTQIPVLPPELMFLPRFAPLNIYDFACWARQTVVALTVVSAHRPVQSLGFDTDELRSGGVAETRDSLRRWSGRFQALDRILHQYERHPIRPLRKVALRQSERWILKRQEADGSWGGIQPPWVYSLIALKLQGYDIDHPVMRAGLNGLDGFTIEDEAGRRIEACQSPVWDTALAVSALADAGLSPEDPTLLVAARYLLGEEITSRGDWSIRRPKLEPSGWAFEFENDTYPDVDDTAEVVLALGRTAEPTLGATARAVTWIKGMQCDDGGWAAFDVDNVQALMRELPFSDFGELIDPSSADVTAHVLEMLAAVEPSSGVIERGVEWLLAAQEDDGSWFGRWGANYVYGTGAVLPGLAAAGLPLDHPAMRRAVSWLEGHQNLDGGWGEDLRSYRDVTYRGRGPSTASQTSWALLGLLAAGECTTAVERGVEYLIETQDDDGSWEEPWFTGTGFPGDFYINYHLYRLVFPVMALGRYLSGRGPFG